MKITRAAPSRLSLEAIRAATNGSARSVAPGALSPLRRQRAGCGGDTPLPGKFLRDPCLRPGTSRRKRAHGEPPFVLSIRPLRSFLFLYHFMDEQTGSEARRPSAWVTKPVRGELGFEHGNNYLRRRWKPFFPTLSAIHTVCSTVLQWKWCPFLGSQGKTPGPRLREAEAWGRGSLKLEPTQTTGPGQRRVPSPSAGKSSLVCTRPGTKASVCKCCATLKLVPLCPHPLA